MYYCQDALITYTLHFHGLSAGFHSLPVCHILGVRCYMYLDDCFAYVQYFPPWVQLSACACSWPSGRISYPCVPLLRRGSVHIHVGCVIVLGAPVAACCVSAPCLDFLVPFVWRTVCHCLEVFCLFAICCPLFTLGWILLAGCALYLCGPCPVCSCCCSAILCAAMHCLDVL